MEIENLSGLERALSKIIIVGHTDTGKTRTSNEDCILCLPELGIALLADGMVRGDAHEVIGEVFGRRLETIVKESMNETVYADLIPSWVNKTSREDVQNFLMESGREFMKFAAKVNSTAYFFKFSQSFL